LTVTHEDAVLNEMRMEVSRRPQAGDVTIGAGAVKESARVGPWRKWA